ncbi:hypothetical protein [Streptomyces sp. NPDC047939]|uniref:hypothetical protein n=1 Tax=Streptomyces sp. NPDC047939 TaxID=3155381 RepID=UPI00342196B0
MPPGDLARLLAAVGVLLGSHSAGDLVVVPREELERREFAAYGQGWRDAVTHWHQHAEWADGLTAGEADDRTPGQAAVIPFRRRITHGARDEAQRDTTRREGTDHAGAAPPKALAGPARPAPDAADPAAREAAGPPPIVPGPGPADARPTDHTPTDHTPTGTGPGATNRGRGDPAPVDGVRAGPDGARPGSPPLTRPAIPPRPPAFAPKNRRSKVPTIPRLPRPRRQGRSGGQE